MLQRKMCISVVKSSYVRKEKNDPDKKCSTPIRVEPMFVLLNMCTNHTGMDSD